MTQFQNFNIFSQRRNLYVLENKQTKTVESPSNQTLLLFTLPLVTYFLFFKALGKKYIIYKPFPGSPYIGGEGSKLSLYQRPCSNAYTAKDTQGPGVSVKPGDRSSAIDGLILSERQYQFTEFHSD